MKETRNVLIESARIARGNIKPLVEFEVENFDAIIFPGVGTIMKIILVQILFALSSSPPLP